eukprot:3215144-Pleurochrysis_carterae.AAC.1
MLARVKSARNPSAREPKYASNSMREARLDTRCSMSGAVFAHLLARRLQLVVSVRGPCYSAILLKNSKGKGKGK